MTFGASVRGTRQFKGLLQSDIARRSGISPSAISRFESGKSDSLGKTLSAIADSLNSYFYLAPNVGLSTTEASERIRGNLKDDSPREAFRGLVQFSDGLRQADITGVVMSTVTPPVLTGDRNFDAALAGISHHHLDRLGLPVHPWVLEQDRYADFDRKAFGFKWSTANLGETDLMLREHGVILPRQILESV